MKGTTRHRDIAEEAAHELARLSDVHAVLLGGSVGRGEHRASSDIDLLIVGSDELDLTVRQLHGDLLVERISHTEQDWITRFDRPKTSWLYAFLEATVLYDTGPANRLLHQARSAQSHYRAAPELKSQLATFLWHGQAKLDRVQPGDAQAEGFWASIFTETIIDALYTIHDVPLPAGSRRLAYLQLIVMTTQERADLNELLTSDTSNRFAATKRLVQSLRSQLGPADHDT